MSLSSTKMPGADSPKVLSTAPNPQSLTFPEKVWSTFACFRSIQLAIVLLSLLALATLAGVLIPQEGVVDLLEIKRDFGANYRLLNAMGLFHVYSSYWFIALEVMFFFNLLLGSFQWLRPAFLAATRKTFCGPEHIQASPHKLVYESTQPVGPLTGQIMALLKRHRYRLHTAPATQQRSGQVLLYACKGNLSRLGPVVAHFGILMMLVASVYGVFFGFKAQKLAVPGETFEIQNSQMFKPNVNPSVWLGSVPKWKLRVNDFRIEYYPEGQTPPGQAPGQATVKQYFADLSVVNPDGKVAKREVISVNHPLTVDDTVIYQASFNPTGKLFMEVNGKPTKLDTNTKFMNRPVSMTELGNGRALLVFPFMVQQDPGVTRNYVVVFLRDKNGFVGAKPGKMPPNLRLLEGQSGQLSGMTFKYIKPEIATGLQIKKGPEVPWMYLSYLTIIIGTMMCVFSQRQLWVAILTAEDGKTTRLMVQYKTNKARLSFMKELQHIQTELLNHSGCQLATTPSAEPTVTANEPAQHAETVAV